MKWRGTKFRVHLADKENDGQSTDSTRSLTRNTIPKKKKCEKATGMSNLGTLLRCSLSVTCAMC